MQSQKGVLDIADIARQRSHPNRAAGGCVRPMVPREGVLPARYRMEIQSQGTLSRP